MQPTPFLTKYQFIIQLVVAVATFAVVIVALFQEKIKAYWSRATLKVEIIPGPPDCIKILAFIDSPGDYKPISIGMPEAQDVIFTRLRVSHLSGDSASNVEVMLVNCWEYKGNKEVKLANFQPMNLVWSHFQPRTDTIRIPSGLFRHCDLGYLMELTNVDGDKDSTLFVFSTITQPNKMGDDRIPANVLPPGKYKIEVWVSGENTETIKKFWSIETDGKWDGSEDTILRKHLIIKEIG